MIEDQTDMLPREIHAMWDAADNAVFWARHEMIARAHRREVIFKILCIAALALGSWAILWFGLGSLATVIAGALELIP